MDISLLEKLDEVRLVGHPFAPMGMGEHVRCVLRAIRAVGASPKAVDVYKLSPRNDPTLVEELNGALADGLGPVANILHLNGDELEQAIPHLGGLPKDAINIAYPAWELPRYPEVWARRLEAFDEVWAPSAFIAESIAASVSVPVIHMPLACEPRMRTFLGRRHFGIPESSFAFLYFFDFTSFVARKNPMAVVDAFARAYAKCGEPDACLVLKLNRGDLAREDYVAFTEEMRRRRERIVLIDATLNEDEIRNLVHCCDAFVSLHRAEGFGRGMAEAMALGRPVIATGWSGNLDFMDADTACLVDATLVPVGPGEYPHGDGQQWAEPDVGQAAFHMARLIRDRRFAAELGRRASRKLRVEFSYRARGLAYAQRIIELLGGDAAPPPRHQTPGDAARRSAQA
ncbi:MAG: glycosyltransferase [Burkholderiales bacterium]|jgi:glycosyltransferase involved in cell wall biosynthesis